MIIIYNFEKHETANYKYLVALLTSVLQGISAVPVTLISWKAFFMDVKCSVKKKTKLIAIIYEKEIHNYFCST